MSLQDLLSAYGLNEREIAVYQALLKARISTVSALSKELGFPRSSVYVVLDVLTEKGLVRSESAANATRFSISDPTVFSKLVEEEQLLLDRKLSVAKQLEKSVSSLSDTTQREEPRLRIVEGQKQV